jgi:hypothetical protein
MDEIHGLRDKYGADVAVLVVDDPMGCGLSIRVGAVAPQERRKLAIPAGFEPATLCLEVSWRLG